jgi:group I intron endonuclease
VIQFAYNISWGDNMNGKIYGIKNNKNSKLYIGQTILELKERFQRHTANNKTYKNTIISKSIKSIGKENFEIFLIEGGFKDYEKLNEAEEYYIKKYNTIQPNGYNLCPGGQKWRKKPNTTDEQFEDIIQLYVNGASFREIEEKYRVDRRRISKQLKEMGIQIRKRNYNLPDRTSDVTKDIMIDLYINKKMKLKDIAVLLNVHVKTISRAKKRFNL